jgi:hypothetical protein
MACQIYTLRRSRDSIHTCPSYVSQHFVKTAYTNSIRLHTDYIHSLPQDWIQIAYTILHTDCIHDIAYRLHTRDCIQNTYTGTARLHTDCIHENAYRLHTLLRRDYIQITYTVTARLHTDCIHEIAYKLNTLLRQDCIQITYTVTARLHTDYIHEIAYRLHTCDCIQTTYTVVARLHTGYIHSLLWDCIQIAYTRLHTDWIHEILYRFTVRLHTNWDKLHIAWARDTVHVMDDRQSWFHSPPMIIFVTTLYSTSIPHNMLDMYRESKNTIFSVWSNR